MNEKILCVDDEANILESYQRTLRKQYHIDTALGAEKGLAAIASRGPYAVIVSDMRMPGVDGIQFLAKVKDMLPDSVRIMLTGQADQYTAIQAVNEGNIFRFLTKPCSPDVLTKALDAGIQQYRLVMAEKDLLEKTLSGSIQILTDVLSLVNPTAFGRAARVRRLVSQLVAVLKVENAWQIEVAAMLSQVGCVTISEETLAKIYKGISLSVDELWMLQAHPQIGHDLIANIPRLEQVAEIIAYQEKLYNGMGLPHDDKYGQGIHLGARILKLALDFDKIEGAGMSRAEALKRIEARDGWYDPTVVEALRIVMGNEAGYEIRSVLTDELSLDMVLDQEIVSIGGHPLFSKGQEVTSPLRARLMNYAKEGTIANSIKVLVPTKASPKDQADSEVSNTPQSVA
jgi:response regulator RpfG family c-di-GMP phosphodiesterase